MWTFRRPMHWSTPTTLRCPHIPNIFDDLTCYAPGNSYPRGKRQGVVDKVSKQIAVDVSSICEMALLDCTKLLFACRSYPHRIGWKDLGPSGKSEILSFEEPETSRGHYSPGKP